MLTNDERRFLCGQVRYCGRGLFDPRKAGTMLVYGCPLIRLAGYRDEALLDTYDHLMTLRHHLDVDPAVEDVCLAAKLDLCRALDLSPFGYAQTQDREGLSWLYRLADTEALHAILDWRQAHDWAVYEEETLDASNTKADL
jgi:hypothetical protein